MESDLSGSGGAKRTNEPKKKTKEVSLGKRRFVVKIISLAKKRTKC